MNFNKWTVAKKLWCLSILTIVILVGLQTYNVHTSRQLTSRILDIGMTQLPVVRAMTMVDMMHDGLRAVVFRSLVGVMREDKSELEEASKEYVEFSQNIEKYLNEIKQSKVDDEIKKKVDAAHIKVKSYVLAGQKIQDKVSSGSSAEAMVQLPVFQAAFKDLETELEVLGESIEAQSQDRVKESEVYSRAAQWWALVATAIGLAISILLSYSINANLVKTLRGIVGGLEEQTEALHGYTEGVSQTSKSLSSASQQSASAVQETASAIEEINAMVAKTAENTQSLAQTSQNNHHSVQEGQAAVEQMLLEINAIKDSNVIVMQQIEDSNEQIKKIVRVVGEIGEKAKVINEIVFQTKLLSFNASVEAARAGENGKGFAVVAEEVGNLALMSGQAAKEITQMLENGIRQVNEIINSNSTKISKSMHESTAKIENGKTVADQCGSAFTKIVGQTTKISQLTSETLRAIQEQQIGLNEINTAIRLFSESTEANSATAGESAKISEQLKNSFNRLNHLMHELQATVNGENSSSVDKTTNYNSSEEGREEDSIAA